MSTLINSHCRLQDVPKPKRHAPAELLVIFKFRLIPNYDIAKKTHLYSIQLPKYHSIELLKRGQPYN
eukprot:1124456-Ditylum_brightwellii.AAC.1